MSAVITTMTACDSRLRITDLSCCQSFGEKTQGIMTQCHATPGLEAASNQPESGDQETKRDPERELDLSWPGLSGAQLAAQHPVSLGGVSRVPARLMAVSGL